MESTVPSRKIQTDADLAHWLNSKGCVHYQRWINHLSHAVVGKVLGSVKDDECSVVIKKLEAMLERLETISSDHPPLAASQRFGNLAFRTYAQQLQQELPDLIAALLPPSHAHLQPLLLPLLADTSAFGNSTRLDYGTGHELAFFLFLYALRASDVLTEGDDEAVVLRVFPKYLELVWSLQDLYRLEPAGSHGSWGLDDYGFLPYVFGSAQLLNSGIEPSSLLKSTSTLARPPRLRSINPDDPNTPISVPSRIPSSLSSLPSSSPTPTTTIAKDLYSLALDRISKLKTGPWHEHSPLLHTLATSIPQGWPKIHSGLLKMYQAECLGKKVVVQHLVVGGLIDWSV